MDRETGEIQILQPEFAVMSKGRRSQGQGGLGYKWYQQYFKSDATKDFITVNRVKMAIPDYYYRLLEVDDPERYKEIKKLHVKMAKEKAHDNTKQRLAEREKCKKRQIQTLTRHLEEI